MTRIRSDQPLMPSVLDRLLDDDPTATQEVPKSRTQVLRELKQSVRRDLENLLNTRRCWSGWPDHLEELGESLVNYGLPDITGLDLASGEQREEFFRTLEAVVRYFEPRFAKVSIEIQENSEMVDRTLRMRIDGLLHATPAPEPVVFDSAVELATGNVEVGRANR
jgi:type VI secretion system protein ImpF